MTTLINFSKSTLVKILTPVLFAFALAACTEVAQVPGQSGGQVGGQAGATAKADPRSQLLVSMMSDVGLLGTSLGADRFSVARFYTQVGNNPVWLAKNSWTADAAAVHRTLSAAAYEGLNPSQYLHPTISSGLPTQGDDVALIAAELYLTSGLLAYARDVNTGRFNKDIATYPAEGIAAAMRGGYFQSYLTNLGPQTEIYQGLRGVLQQRFNSLNQNQKNRIALNMERARWSNEPVSGKAVRVNIPAFTLTTLSEGKPEFSMPVVVGRGTRATPLLEDRITNLKYSPDWGVPKSIFKEDFLPKLKKDKQFLARSGYEIYRGGKKVSFSSVNFSDPQVTNKYSLRKPPGRTNPLGGIRFSLTNRQSIYLHDTPGNKQFSLDDRSVSSGCVRVSDPTKLASWIHDVQGTPMSQAQIKANMRLKKPKVIVLKNKIPVSLAYYTTYVDAGGRLQNVADIYGLDGDLAAKMGFSL